MAGSYSKINYRLRPAKAVERKIICDSLRELSPFGDLGTYRYIGFGSTYFSDFILFHKRLHIEDMISIEKDTHAKERFEYNKPFGCIQIKYGNSCEVIPSLRWDKKSIVWLDYDNPLNQDVLEDIDSLVGNLKSGSVLIVTVSAQQERSSEPVSREQLEEYRLNLLKERINQRNLPIDLKPNDLTGKNLGGLYKRIIDNQIGQSISNFNAARSAEELLEFRQIFYFRYADDAQMITVGWVFFDHSSRTLADKCTFNKYLNLGNIDILYSIEVPNLTTKEVHYLDSKMPAIDCENLDRICIPLKDVKHYSEIYKYYPSFVERLM
jgi:hypothetical protein